MTWLLAFASLSSCLVSEVLRWIENHTGAFYTKTLSLGCALCRQSACCSLLEFLQPDETQHFWKGRLAASKISTIIDSYGEIFHVEGISTPRKCFGVGTPWSKREVWLGRVILLTIFTRRDNIHDLVRIIKIREGLIGRNETSIFRMTWRQDTIDGLSEENQWPENTSAHHVKKSFC